MGGRTTVALRQPVEIGGRRYSELRLRRAKPRDLAGIDPQSSFVAAGEIGAANLAIGVAITARLAGVPEAVIFALSAEDAARVGRAVEGLIAGIS